MKDEILEIEDQCSEFRLRKDVLVTRSKKLEPIALEAIVDTDEIRDFYDQLRAGLGTSIVRDLNEVISFKSKIENFQHYLLQEKRKIINVEIRKLNSQLSELDNRYATLMSVLDQEGHLSNLRQTYASFQAKSDELGQLKSFLGRYDALLIERQDKKSQIEAENLLLRASILAVSEQLESFQRSIIAIHYFIQGNRNASFGVSVTAKKHVVDIILRIDDDGSHSVEREKVFIYDIALLLNVYTKYRHPGILIHDNIFDVDDDTLQRNLEFILTRARFDDEQQYILTINLDRIEHYQDEFWFYELEKSIVASFTKKKRFLKSHYQEVK